MQKKLILLCSFLISFFMFSSKADAVYMYLECDYGSACARADCETDWNKFYILTEPGGGQKSMLQEGNGNDFHDLAGYWAKSLDALEKDSDESSYYIISDNIGEVSEKLQSGVCPAGARESRIWFDGDALLGGTTTPKASSELTKSVYRIYNKTRGISFDVRHELEERR